MHLGPEFVCTNSLTKVYGLSGLRCGWILAEPELAERMWRLNDLFGVNQAHPAERLACIAFEHIEEVIGDNPAMLERNRALFNDFVRSREDVECMPAEHGITAFPRWAGGDTDRLDAHLRERHDTAVVPGRWFEMPDHFRVGFGLRTDEFAEALTRLGAALDESQMKREEVFEFFRRLAEANPSPTTELEYHEPLSPARRGRALRPSDRCERKHRHAARCSNASRRRDRWWISAKSRCARRSKPSACSTPRQRT